MAKKELLETLDSDTTDEVAEICDDLKAVKAKVKALPKNRQTSLAVTKIEEAALWLIGFASLMLTEDEEKSATS